MRIQNSCRSIGLSILLLLVVSSSARSQVVNFRLETTDSMGVPIEAVTVGESFLLKAYTQHVGGYESADNAGVFAGYLDISYDPALASTLGEVVHGELYSNVKSGDLSVAGLFDNIGGVSSSGDLGIGIDPIGTAEEFLFEVELSADAVGDISFVGSESLSYPAHDVLVYASDEPVSARDVDFGQADLRLSFGAAELSVVPVPEPTSCLLFATGMLGVLSFRKH